VKAAIDFGFVREAVAHCYGKTGTSRSARGDLEDDVLLFFDDIKSERELMEVIGERSITSGFWTTDWTKRSPITACSVKRERVGKEVFESLFVRTVAQWWKRG